MKPYRYPIPSSNILFLPSLQFPESTEGFTWVSGYCDDCKMLILWFHFPFYINFLFYYKKVLSFSFTHLSFVWAHGFLFYSVSYNPLFPLFMLVLRLSQRVQCLLTAISYILLSFPISITLWALSYFLAYQLVLSLPQPWSPSFLQGATFCSWGTVYSFLCGCQEECF